MEKEEGKMSPEERKMAKVNSFLEDIDAQLERLIINIQKEKDIKDVKTGNRSVYETSALNNLLDTINAIHIDGNESVLIAISSKYDKAIEILEGAVKEDPEYASQMKAELGRLLTNKTERFDPISETYKEFAQRVDRGEIEGEYYRGKADEKGAEIEAKEEFYKKKRGNFYKVAAQIKQPVEALRLQIEIGKKYNELSKINNEVKRTELELKAPDLDESKKEELTTKLEGLKEKRGKLVEEFQKIAVDKDGKKIEKAEGKSDQEFIDGINPMIFDEALEARIAKVKEAVLAMPEEDRKATFIGQDLQEAGEFDLSTNFDLNTIKGIEALVSAIGQQNALWNAKMKADGYDKSKLQEEQDYYQKKSIGQIEEVADGSEQLVPVKTKFWERFKFNRQYGGRIKSFFGAFARRKVEEKMNEVAAYNAQQSKLNEIKSQGLSFLEKNRVHLSKVNTKNKNDVGVAYNIALTQDEINKFFDKKEQDAHNKEDDGER